VFLSHAGEQKAGLVSCMHQLLTRAAGVSAFLDEKHLAYGDGNAGSMEARLRAAPLGASRCCGWGRAWRPGQDCTGMQPTMPKSPARRHHHAVADRSEKPHPRLPQTHAVVLVVTRDYLCKKWPMWELGIALERWQSSGGDSGFGGSTGGGGSGSGSGGGRGSTGGGAQPVRLLLVLVDVTTDELGDLAGTLYADPRAWDGKKQSPAAEELARWAALGKRLTGVVCMRRDQVPQAAWQGDLAEKVMLCCIEELKREGHLPPGYAVRDPRALPMSVGRVGHSLVGRAADAVRLSAELLGGARRVLLRVGPGEGKTALARSVAVALFEEEGAFPGGAFEVDATGGA
jgi:hypothetical protein